MPDGDLHDPALTPLADLLSPDVAAVLAKRAAVKAWELTQLLADREQLLADRDTLDEEMDALLDEIAELRRLLRQFGSIKIPDNWPGHCKLRIDRRPDGSEYIAYYGVPEQHLGILPQICYWREAAEAGKEETDGSI